MGLSGGAAPDYRLPACPGIAALFPCFKEYLDSSRDHYDNSKARVEAGVRVIEVCARVSNPGTENLSGLKESLERYRKAYAQLDKAHGRIWSRHVGLSNGCRRRVVSDELAPACTAQLKVLEDIVWKQGIAVSSQSNADQGKCLPR